MLTGDRAALDALQLAALRELVATLLEKNPFYRAKLRAARLEGPPASLAEFAARVPFTRKTELMEDQERRPPYGTNLTFPLERYTRFCQTSAMASA